MYIKRQVRLEGGVYFIFLLGFCLFLPNIHITALSNQAVLPREFLIYVASLMFVTFLLQREYLKYNTFFIIASVFCVWQFFSLLWTNDLGSGLRESLNYFYFLLCAFAFFQIEDSHRRRIVVLVLVAAVSISALIGILQNFDWNPLQLFQASLPSSTFVNKNLAASVCMLFLPISIVFLLTAEDQHTKILFLVPNVLLLSFILVSQSKGVWLACIMIFLVAVIFVRMNVGLRNVQASVKSNLPYIIIVVILSLIIFLLPGVRKSDKEFSELVSNSMTTRLGMYRDSIPLILDSPVHGVGSGSFRVQFRSVPGGPYASQHAENDKYVTRLHNDHLEILVEYGLVGFMLWASMIYLIIYQAFKYLLDEKVNSKEKPIAFAFLLGIAGMMIHSLFSFPVRLASTGGLFWICIGLLYSYQKNSSTKEKIHSNSINRYLTLILYLPLFIFSVYFVSGKAIGSYYLQKAEDALFISGDCGQTKDLLKKSIDMGGMNTRLAHIQTNTYDICGDKSPSDMLLQMNNILEYEPNQSLALVVKGKLSFVMGNYFDAMNHFRTALLINPHSNKALMGLNESLKRAKLEDKN